MYPIVEHENGGAYPAGKVTDQGIRPRIAITAWRRELPTMLGERTRLDALDPAYSERVAEAGGLPLILPRPPGPHPETIAAEALGLVDGLLLSGGGDLAPETSGGGNGSGIKDEDADTDRWELELVRAAASLRLPTLGICRGAQVMALAFGGRLDRRLPPEAGHRDIYELEPEEILAERHPVELVAGSAARAVYGESSIPVNTIHHNSIAEAGDLAVGAVAGGGLIEAVEPRGALAEWPALGVQWHPEKMSEPEQRRPFARLVEDARRYREAAPR
jgi:putative glutamine amidotransferase